MARKEIESARSENGATGPRTLQGKERSKHNALKHGIFSNVVLLKDELKAEFDSLLDGLHEDFQPKGMIESVLVQKLATLLWRHRRLIIAEGAEIQSEVNVLEWDQQTWQFNEAEEIEDLRLQGQDICLIGKIRNPYVLEKCLANLKNLRNRIQQSGFREGMDLKCLEYIYSGRSYRHSPYNVRNNYGVWFRTAAAQEKEPQPGGMATPEECKEYALRDIDAEILRLENLKKEQSVVEASRAKQDALRRAIPDSTGADRLLRYEASLERSFDRTLKQLERLQRMRLGLPVPPSVDLNVST